MSDLVDRLRALPWHEPAIAEAADEIERLTKQRDAARLRSKLMDKYTPCPDHRDKLTTDECMMCQIERLTALCAKSDELFEEWQDMSERQAKTIAELEAENERLKELIWSAVGWCYAEACMNLANGVDMREVAVPDFIYRLKKDIPEVAALKGADDEGL